MLYFHFGKSKNETIPEGREMFEAPGSLIANLNWGMFERAANVVPRLPVSEG